MQKPAGEAALEPKVLRRATELPVPQAAVGCAVSPAGRWRVTRQVALRMRYPNLGARRCVLLFVCLASPFAIPGGSCQAPLPRAPQGPPKSFVEASQACQERALALLRGSAGHSSAQQQSPHPNTTQALNTRRNIQSLRQNPAKSCTGLLCGSSRDLSQGSASKQKRFDPAHLLSRVHLFRSRLEASSQGSIGRELKASSQTQTQTLHLPGLDMSNWFRSGRPRARSREPDPAQPLKKVRPSPSLLDESICSGLKAPRQGSLGRKLGASSQT